ncbi:ATP-binding protein [Paraburkholderia hospita]|uniref:ATP-binding protein n=1 Tax=Paraburkholderia hospita TaxID=169430 RepID=UPI000271BEB2|nr:ATP-binding protein [Paraburkholderia hospita]EUC16540.1 hypothetical protein PMI06_004874 [Burkholderia sp. BT03]SKC77818.1 AAA domain-containing protein [Paraburkholderia hospita]
MNQMNHQLDHEGQLDASLFDDLQALDGTTRKLIHSLTYEWVTRHLHFDEALRRVIGYIDDDLPGQLIPIIGESRTGKSALLHFILRYLNSVARQSGRKIGGVLIELSVSQNGQFDAYDLYYKALAQMGAALISQKIPYPPMELGAPSRKDLAAKGRLRGLEYAFKQAALNERFTLLIDDVNTQVGTLSANALRRFAEILKYTTNNCVLTVVVAGCPELTVLTSQTDQLVARREQVELHVYRLGEEQAICDFLGELEKIVCGWCQPGTLSGHPEEIMFLSFGRVGLIVSWTARVIGQESRAGNSQFKWNTWKDFASSRHCALQTSSSVSFSDVTGEPGGDAKSVDEDHRRTRAPRGLPGERKPRNRPLHPHGQ